MHQLVIPMEIGSAPCSCHLGHMHLSEEITKLDLHVRYLKIRIRIQWHVLKLNKIANVHL
jgi:hypothetical protein